MLIPEFIYLHMPTCKLNRIEYVLNIFIVILFSFVMFLYFHINAKQGNLAEFFNDIVKKNQKKKTRFLPFIFLHKIKRYYEHNKTNTLVEKNRKIQKKFSKQ